MLKAINTNISVQIKMFFRNDLIKINFRHKIKIKELIEYIKKNYDIPNHNKISIIYEEKKFELYEEITDNFIQINKNDFMAVETMDWEKIKNEKLNLMDYFIKESNSKIKNEDKSGLSSCPSLISNFKKQLPQVNNINKTAISMKKTIPATSEKTGLSFNLLDAIAKCTEANTTLDISKVNKNKRFDRGHFFVVERFEDYDDINHIEIDSDNTFNSDIFSQMPSEFMNLFPEIQNETLVNNSNNNSNINNNISTQYYDESMLSALLEMGFEDINCRIALRFTRNNLNEAMSLLINAPDAFFTDNNSLGFDNNNHENINNSNLNDNVNHLRQVNLIPNNSHEVHRLHRLEGLFYSFYF